jgi:hypothetical protein
MMDDVRDRSARPGYDVDPAAVAAAILDRLVAGRTLPVMRLPVAGGARA